MPLPPSVPASPPTGAGPSESAPSPVPRRIRAPRWLDARMALGITLVLSAVLLGVQVVGRARQSEPRLVFTHPLAAGATVRAVDVRSVGVHLDAAVSGYARRPAEVVGRRLNRPVTAGELVALAAVTAAPRRTTMSLPLAAGAAPPLTRGQRIVVWLSSPQCPAAVLLPDVTVQEVRTDERGGFGASGAGQDVVVDVSAELADRVVGALAIGEANIRAGVLAGAPDAAVVDLPALAGCGAGASPTS